MEIEKILEDKTEITVSGILSRYNHDAGKAMMNKTVNLFQPTFHNCSKQETKL